MAIYHDYNLQGNVNGKTRSTFVLEPNIIKGDLLSPYISFIISG